MLVSCELLQHTSSVQHQSYQQSLEKHVLIQTTNFCVIEQGTYELSLITIIEQV